MWAMQAASHLHVHHVGRGVDHSQRAVHFKGLRKGAPLKALTQYKLEHVARCNVLLGRTNRTQELLLQV
jgi:hypothetical protein